MPWLGTRPPLRPLARWKRLLLSSFIPSIHMQCNVCLLQERDDALAQHAAAIEAVAQAEVNTDAAEAARAAAAEATLAEVSHKDVPIRAQLHMCGKYPAS